MAYTKEDMKRDLFRLGICPGDTVMLHSSYKSLGGIEGGARAVFEAFEEVLGEDGTLVLPAFSYDFVTYDRPVFDRAETATCIGFLPEYFRTSVPGVVRSLHATHSCCVKGKRAAELIDGHETDRTPVGPHSPITKLAQSGGKTLFLGCSPNHNTALHGVEESVGVPYVFSDRPIRYTLIDGDRTIERDAIRHGFRKGGWYYDQRYARVVDLLEETAVTRGKVLDADCVLLSAGAVWRCATEKMKEDPYYFVEKTEG